MFEFVSTAAFSFSLVGSLCYHLIQGSTWTRLKRDLVMTILHCKECPQWDLNCNPIYNSLLSGAESLIQAWLTSTKMFPACVQWMKGPVLCIVGYCCWPMIHCRWILVHELGFWGYLLAHMAAKQPRPLYTSRTS
jgi:hypothetical protein